MKRSLLWAAVLLASQSSLAQIEGHVRDEQGQPIPGATIEVVGTKIRTQADNEGKFSLPQVQDAHVELHVRAPDYTHKTVHIHEGDGPVELVLANSSIDIVNVIGLPWHASNMESAQPINVLSAEKLRDRQASTLGETLKHEVGVHSSYYGPVASSPIIRGLDGPRVLITQNGLDAGDASRVGPDHAVATEASTARQIEILRGPATLFYGSGAIGGVVNIVDDRVPQSTETNGEWRLEQDSVADDKLVSASGNSGIGNVGLHLDGFWRDAGNYKIPGPAAIESADEHAEEGHDHSGRLANSFAQAKGINLGGSFILDEGFVGLSYGHLERQYGIPGHNHGDDDVNVYADLKQDRLQFISELTLDHDFFSATKTRFGFTDYEHSEIENGAIGTTFRNETAEARWELFHHPIAEWRGALSVHYKHSNFEAIGEEAFTPPSKTDTLALGLMEERHFGDFLVQLGARVEQVKISANDMQLDLNDHDHADEHNHSDEFIRVFDFDHESTPFSASAGIVWDFTRGYNIGLSYTHAERTPSAAELLAFGPHLGSGLYEVGAILQLIEEDDHFHFDLARTDLELETSNNLDLSLRKFEGNFGFVLNAFYNQIDNYYYLSQTNAVYDVEHDHGDEDHADEEHDHEHAAELPIFIYQAQDAKLYGFEGEINWQLSAPLKVSFTTDYTRAQLKDGGDLPRIPPLRIGASAEYEIGSWRAELSGQHYFEQDKTAPLESATDGYTLIDAQLSYAISDQLKIYLKGNNLTDEYARVHASFLKDKAPLPARSYALGISGNF